MSDKGNVSVVMDRADYVGLCNELLDDDNYYVKLRRDPVSTLEQKANKLVSKFKSSNKITNELASNLMMYNSVLARFYALPKIHKPTLSLRPIVASINTPNSKIDKFLASILSKSYNRTNDFYIEDSFSFSTFIDEYQLPENHILISLDVVSLFTNLPLDLARQSITTHWDDINQHSPVDLDTFLEFLNFTFDSTCFVFNNQFYKQIFGCPMGASLSPVLANYVMDDLVAQTLPLLSFRPPFVKRYVDDLILAIPDDKVEETLFIFNLADQHVQFTIEKESNNCISFLDMTLIRQPNNQIITKWYRKPISSGRYLHFLSDHPTKMKLGLVGALAARVSRLTHFSLRRESLNELKSLLLENSYPNSIIQRLLFHNNDLNRSLLNIQNQFLTPNVLPHVTPDPNTTVYRSLPHIKGLTPKLIKIFKNENIKFATRIDNTLRCLFTNLKHPVSKLQKTGVVYKIPCLDCHLSYIGQTSRSLQGRITSHKSDCRRSTQSCALAQHFLQRDHRINFGEAEILYSEKNYYKRRFLEMVAIRNIPGNMNIKTDVDDLSVVYSYLLQLSTSPDSPLVDH